MTEDDLNSDAFIEKQDRCRYRRKQQHRPREGAYECIASCRQAEIDKAVAEIGKNVTGVKTNISKLEDLDRLYKTVAKKGKIDVIFAGAAFVEKQVTGT